jgi:hypothetical protein
MQLLLSRTRRFLAFFLLAALALPALAAAPGDGRAAAGDGIPTHGACGFSTNLSYPFVAAYGRFPGPDWGVSAFGTIDFGASQITVNMVVQNITNTVPPISAQQRQYSLPFTVSSGPIPGSRQLMFTLPGGTTEYVNLLAVNQGSQLVMQMFSPTPNAQDAGVSTVCYMQ